MKTTYNNWMMLAMSLLMTTATTTALTACSDDDPVMEEQMPTMLTGGKPMLGDDATKRAFLTDWENCYTGVLRVFHYIEKATGYGDELVYLVTGSESRKDDRYPLYHSMEYGIPACHQLGTTLDNSVKLQSAGATQDAFSCYVAPYTKKGVRGLNLTPELMAASNPYGNLGTGVWGLEEDPVVYISDEDLMAATDHINMNITDKGYTNSEFKDYDVRLVTFYDPSSIKLNLNTDIFHNIRDLVVTTNYGVYTNRQIGNTDSYRRLMKLNSRPTFKINYGKTSGLVRLNRATNPVIHQIDINDLIVDGYELPGDKTTAASNSEEMKELDKCSFTKLPGSDVNIYGRQVNMLGQQIVMMPQVFVPYVDGGIISNPVTPDFLVTVNVTFVCDEGAMQFSKTFVPQIKIIKQYELMSHLYRLNEYCQKSANNVPVATLNNNPAVKVYDHHSSLFMKRTIKMLRMMVQ